MSLDGRSARENKGIKATDLFPRLTQDFGSLPLTPRSMTVISHRQAGDLHTPTLGSNLTTPIFMWERPCGDLPVDPHTEMSMYNFENQFMPKEFHNSNSFAQKTGDTPYAFTHPDSGFDLVNWSNESPSNSITMQESQLNVVAPTDSSLECMDVNSMDEK
jgi:hypothetical protein